MSRTTETISLPQVGGQTGYPVRARVAMGVAGVAAGFCATVVVVLVLNWMRERVDHPLVEMTIAAMKVELAARPDDGALKEAIREADREMRARYFGRRAFAVHGGWLLLGGAVVLVLALKSAAAWAGPVVALPAPVDPWSAAAVVRRSLAVGGLGVVGFFVAVGLMGGGGMGRWGDGGRDGAVVAKGGPSPRPSPGVPGEGEVRGGLGEGEGRGAQGEGAVSQAEIARNWAGFRGAGGVGVVNVALDANGEGLPPVAWDGTTGKNIAWKVAVPLPGNNSPIVWGDLVFLSGATAEERAVFCFDAKTGKLLWRRDVPTAVRPPPEVMEDTGFAAPTMATDGRRVFAIFATGDLAAFELDGTPAWSKALGKLQSIYGFAASLRVWRGRLIVQLDQGKPDAPDSALIAFDGATGEQLWRTKRPVPASWTSPIVVETPAGAQIVTAADPWVIGYEPQGGKELWRAKALHGDVAPSPAYADGIVYVAQESADLVAVRTDGSGDVTETHIAWKSEDRMPDIVSPLATAQFVLIVLSDGMLGCYDAKTGEFKWEHELMRGCSASPVLAGRRVYQLDDEGIMHIFEAWPAFKLIGTAELGEECVATPAFAQGRLFIRGKRHLYCVESKE